MKKYYILMKLTFNEKSVWIRRIAFKCLQLVHKVFTFYNQIRRLFPVTYGLKHYLKQNKVVCFVVKFKCLPTDLNNYRHESIIVVPTIFYGHI